MRTLHRVMQVAILLTTSSTLAADPNESDRQLAKQLATELKAALSTALQTSPEQAIAVCNERAPAIASKLAHDNNVAIGRTSLKVRNSKNAPNAWQHGVLLDFQNRLAAGESLATMEYAADVQVQDHIEHRYMKAIAVEPLCVTCHGTQIAPALKDAIRSKYPTDVATGYAVGELRGAAYLLRRTPLAKQ